MKFRIEGSIFKSLSLALLVAIILSGCGPAMAPKPILLNIPQPNNEASVGELLVGPFLDERPNADMGPTYFGTIRGGYGNPLERLKLEKPVSEAMSEVVVNVLHNAGYRTKPIPTSLRVNYSGSWFITNDDSPKSQTPLVVGRIKSFQASNNPWTFPSGSRNIEINVEICMLDPQLQKPIWCDTISGNDRDTGSAGVSGNAAVMGPWLLRLAGDKTKDLVAKTSIAQLWKEHISEQAPDKQVVRSNSIEDRLSELRRLFDKKLITELEYNQKKSEIIKGL